jgi:hypothetical protein
MPTRCSAAYFTVAHQVRKDLFHLDVIHGDQGQILGHIQLDLVLPGQVPHPFQHAADDLAQDVPLALRLERPRLDARHIQQVPHQQVEVVGFVVDGGHQLGARGRVPAHLPAAQAGGGRFDRGKRRAQLVRDRGQQRRLEPVTLLQHPRA